MTRQLPVRIGYEYPARPRNHQVPCPHRQGVGYGAFCISGTCTSLERCNTLDFVPKSCAKGAAPLWNPCLHRLWAMQIRRTESSHKRHTRLSAARRRHFCGSVITHYDTFIPVVCKVQWALRGGTAVQSAFRANRRIRVYGRWVRTYAVNRPSSPMQRV